MRVFEFRGRLNDECSGCNFDNSLVTKRLLWYLREKDLEISVKEITKTKSAKQNRYFWGLVIPLIQEHHLETEGDKITDEEAYEYCLYEIMGLRPVLKTVFGKQVLMYEDPITLSKMSTKDFMNFKDKIQQHFALKGLIIPDPQQDNFLNDF